MDSGAELVGAILVTSSTSSNPVNLGRAVLRALPRRDGSGGPINPTCVVEGAIWELRGASDTIVAVLCKYTAKSDLIIHTSSRWWWDDS